MKTEEKESGTRPRFLDGGLRFGCTQCGQCCTGAHGIIRVDADEIRALSDSLGMGAQDFKARYLYRIPNGFSIRERENGDCMFLRDGRCSVYGLRPRQCRTYPFWFENVRSEPAWERAAADCPGIGQGRLYTREEVLEIVRSSRALRGAPDLQPRRGGGVTIELSKFGRKLSAQSGINELMHDLGSAMAGRTRMLMMGGGNPARIPAVEKLWRERMRALLEHGDVFDRMLVHYDTPRGHPAFVRSLVDLLNGRFGWNLGEENVAVTNGSQNAFFFLLNALAGDSDEGRRKRILFPLMPEYIGYADQGISSDMFAANRPRIEILGRHEFKYHIDFETLSVGDDVAAICASRPTNPTGNVLTDDEVCRLAELARRHGIPLILDNAYGRPFPDIIFTDAEPFWDGNTVLVFSLSKLGLPGTRTGIVVGPPEIASAVASINAVVSLSTGSVGQGLAAELLAGGELLRISSDIINPFYRRKSLAAQQAFRESFGEDVDYLMHRNEGAFFLWFWFRGLPIPSEELYRRLKARGVLVVPGSYFFFGLPEEWAHRHECIRVTYSQPDEVVREGARIIAEEVRKACAGG
jgi:valine--pyruvate aminotransferase